MTPSFFSSADKCCYFQWPSTDWVYQGGRKEEKRHVVRVVVTMCEYARSSRVSSCPTLVPGPDFAWQLLQDPARRRLQDPAWPIAPQPSLTIAPQLDLARHPTDRLTTSTINIRGVPRSLPDSKHTNRATIKTTQIELQKRGERGVVAVVRLCDAVKGREKRGRDGVAEHLLACSTNGVKEGVGAM